MIQFNSGKPALASARTNSDSKSAIGKKIFVAGAENSLATVLVYGLYERGANISVQTVNHDSAVALKRNFPILHGSPSDERFAHELATFAPEIILHAPAEPTREPSSHWPAATFNRIVERTVAVCEAARRHAPNSRIVMLSSADVYGECSAPASEEHDLRPVSMQGRYLKMAEEVLQDYRDTHGLKITILRVSSAYGPSLRNNPVNTLLLNLLGPQGTNSKTGLNLNATRDLIHAADVVQAVSLILEKTTEGTFNVASGTHLMLNELNTHLCAMLEVNPELAIAESKIHEILSQKIDIGKLKALGFRPQVPLLEGLRGYAAWWSGVKAA